MAGGSAELLTMVLCVLCRPLHMASSCRAVSHHQVRKRLRRFLQLLWSFLAAVLHRWLRLQHLQRLRM